MNEANLVPIGRLNGIKAEPGTVLAVSLRTMEFLAVDSCDDHGVVVRHASPEDMTQMQYGEPRSNAEYHAIQRVSTPYGLVRKIRYPQPMRRVKVEVPFMAPPSGKLTIPNRETRRAMMRNVRKHGR